MAGRPSLYTDELGIEIARRIAAGQSIRKISKDPTMPDFDTIITWAHTAKHPFSYHYDRARENQAETLVDEILDISDDGSNDWMVNKFGETVPNHEHIQRSRLRVDARKWIASKFKPKRFADRIHNEVSGSVSLESLVSESLQNVEKKSETSSEED
jgi:hypothetical protein